MRESSVLKRIMLGLSRGTSRLYRNNCGAYKTDDGRYIRFGVGSPGGGDLIGWRTITVTPDLVGRDLAVFTSIEVKGKRGRLRKEQRKWMENVLRAGGFAGVAYSVEEAERLIKFDFELEQD